MKLWLLYPEPTLSEESDPWYPYYGRLCGCVVRAETEEEARLMAASISGDETQRSYELGFGGPWEDPKLSHCIELTADGPKEIICSDRERG